MHKSTRLSKSYPLLLLGCFIGAATHTRATHFHFYTTLLTNSKKKHQNHSNNEMCKIIMLTQLGAFLDLVLFRIV